MPTPEKAPKFRLNRQTARHLLRPLAFGLGVIAVAALVFWLSGRYLLPKDNLVRLVPADAVAYLHLNLDTPNLKPAGSSTGLRAAVPNLPDKAQPDEAARFVLNRDGQQQTAWLIGWFKRSVSPKEARAMDSLEDSWRTWDNIWLIGDQKLQAALNGTVQRQNGLDRDPLAKQALAAARSLAPVQFYFNPVSLSAQSAAQKEGLLKHLPALVGASLTPEAKRAFIYPLNRSADRPDYRFPVTISHQPTEYGLEASGAGAAYAGPSRSVDWVPLVFSKINRWRLATGLDPVSLPRPAAIHEGPVALSLNQPTGIHDLEVAVLLEGADADSIAERVSAYLDQVLPTRTVTVLPDNDKVTELILGEGHNSFRVTDESGARFLWNRPADLKLYLKPAQDGAVLATAPISDSVFELDMGRCAGIGGSQLIIQDQYLRPVWKTVGLTASQQGEFRLFIENRPNLWISCKVIHKIVDNSDRG